MSEAIEMGYRPAKQWTPTDRTSGEVSVSQLQKKLAADQKACNEWAQSTWEKSPSLSANQIEVLDSGKGEMNAIGQPESLESGSEPRCFSRGTVKGDD